MVTRSTAARAAPDFDRVVSLWTPINAYGRLYRLSQSLFATDIIYRHLALAPVPYLSHAFSVFQFIWSSVQQAQSSKWQLESLSQSIAQLLCMLDGENGAKPLLDVKTLTPLTDLMRFVMLILPWSLTNHRNTDY